jgi:hypothetical protein
LRDAGGRYRLSADAEAAGARTFDVRRRQRPVIRLPPVSVGVLSTA